LHLFALKTRGNKRLGTKPAPKPNKNLRKQSLPNSKSKQRIQVFAQDPKHILKKQPQERKKSKTAPKPRRLHCSNVHEEPRCAKPPDCVPFTSLSHCNRFFFLYSKSDTKSGTPTDLPSSVHSSKTAVWLFSTDAPLPLFHAPIPNSNKQTTVATKTKPKKKKEQIGERIRKEK
jgi:hypothetical protein